MAALKYLGRGVIHTPNSPNKGRNHLRPNDGKNNKLWLKALRHRQLKPHAQ
jgi:hypothetical protein